jgi:HD-like signal output (HDOD) protein
MRSLAVSRICAGVGAAGAVCPMDGVAAKVRQRPTITARLVVMVNSFRNQYER